MTSLADAYEPASTAERLRRFPARRLARYLESGVRQVEGWLTPLSARILAFLLDEQARLGVHGSVGEIGVHHGKLFLVAYLATRRAERAFAVDLFDLQELNVDGSGRGDRERFLANVERHAGSTEGLVVLTADSLKLPPARLLEEAGPARFVSIDGGHTDECTLNDLRLAEACLADGGIILLDDYFNPNWPDVSVGAARHFTSPGAKTKPFLITPNKVFFAEERNHSVYQRALYEPFRSHYARSGRMFGAAVDIYIVDGGIRAIGGAISSAFSEEARMHLARHPRLRSLAKRIVRR